MKTSKRDKKEANEKPFALALLLGFVLAATLLLAFFPQPALADSGYLS